MVRQYLIILCVLIYPSVARSEEICGPQDYSSSTQPNFECQSPGEAEMVPDLHPPQSVPVHQGDSVRASWEGALVHRDRLVELGLRVQALRRLRWADTLRMASEYATNLRHAQEIGRIQLENMQAQRDAYQERWRLTEEQLRQANRWWHSPALWVGVGIVVAGCLVALTAYGLSAVSD